MHDKNRTNEQLCSYAVLIEIILILEACHGKQCRDKILKSQIRFIPFISSLFGLKTESNLLFFPFYVFHWKNSSPF